jgi:hypothetical protein
MLLIYDSYIAHKRWFLAILSGRGAKFNNIISQIIYGVFNDIIVFVHVDHHDKAYAAAYEIAKALINDEGLLTALSVVGLTPEELAISSQKSQHHSDGQSPGVRRSRARASLGAKPALQQC